MTPLDTTTRSTTSRTHELGAHHFRSAGVLLGTIAATGTLGLSAIFALAPSAEALVLVGALGLPWALLASVAAISLPARPARSLSAQAIIAAPRAARASTTAIRMAAATAALALLLLVGLVAQHAATGATTTDGATVSPGETSAQVAAADRRTD